VDSLPKRVRIIRSLLQLRRNTQVLYRYESGLGLNETRLCENETELQLKKRILGEKFVFWQMEPEGRRNESEIYLNES
jgi:hypothetical protein